MILDEIAHLSAALRHHLNDTYDRKGFIFTSEANARYFANFHFAPLVVESKPLPSIKVAVPQVATVVKKEIEAAVPVQETKSALYTIDFKHFKHVLSSIAPEIKFRTQPINDAVAKKVKSAWKEKTIPDFPILYHGNNREERQLLDNLAKAISTRFGPSRVLELDEETALLGSKNMRLIIAPKGIAEKFPSLQIFSTLPIETYLKDPSQKRDLWEKLCFAIK